MRLVRQFLYGVAAVFSSFRKVRGRVYVIIVLLCVAMFVAGVVLGKSLFSATYDLVDAFVSALSLPDFCSGVLPNVVGWIGGVAAWFVAFFVVSLIGGSVILLVLSPILSRVADDGWVKAGHVQPQDSVAGIVRSVVRGIAIAVRCLLLQLLCLILLLVLSFVPVVGVVTPVLGVIVSSFFYGQSLIDYAVERAEQSGAWGGRKPGAFPFSNIGLTVGLGIPFAILTLIPLIGSYFALFVAPAVAFAGGHVLGNAVKK